MPASLAGVVEQWLSVGAAAAQAGVDPGTIRRWADSGVLFSRRTPAGHRRVEASSLRSAMARSRRAPALPSDVYELCARLRDIVDTLVGLDVDALAEDESGVLRDRLCGRFGIAADLGRFAAKLDPNTPVSEARTLPSAPTPVDERRGAAATNPLFDRIDRHLASKGDAGPRQPLTADDARRLLFPASPRRSWTPEDFDDDAGDT